MTVEATIDWLEIAADYRCNNHCLGCFSAHDDGPTMAPGEIVAALRDGRRDGATGLWLGGGEPTLRRDLFAIVHEARARGFTRVKLQTNAMMLAYPAFADRCRDAGVTEVSVSIKGSHAALHDALTDTPNCHATMLRALDEVRRRGLALEADLLVYARNVRDLGEMFRVYAAHGIARFRVWALSSADRDDPAVRAEMPRLGDIARELATVRANDPSLVIESLHTPPCLFAPADRDLAFDVARLRLRVVNPGGHAFRLEASPIEGGAYLPACDACALRARCRGPRRDYLARFGADEFRPVDPA